MTSAFLSEFIPTASILCGICIVVCVWFVRDAGRRRVAYATAQKRVILPDSWDQWVERNFPEGEPSRRTREEATREFDARLFGQLNYQLLQRFAVAAPLIGVIITMYKLVYFQPPAVTESGPAQIIQATAGPLFVGVGSGATAAFVCQLCLLIANWRAKELRLAAQAWFDEWVWSESGPEPEVDMSLLASLLGTFGDDLRAAGQQHRRAAQGFVARVASFEQAADRIDAATRAIEAPLRGLADACQPLQQVVQQLVSLPASLAPLTRGISEFEASIRDRFGPAVDTLQTAANQTESTTRTLRQQVTDFNGQVGRLLRTITAQEEAVTVFGQNVQALTEAMTAFGPLTGQLPALIEAASEFSESALRMDRTTSVLKAAAEDFQRHLGPTGAAISSAAADLQGAGGTLRSSANGFAGAVQNCRTTLATFQQGAGDLGIAMTRVEVASRGLQGFDGGIVEPVRDAAERLASILHDLDNTARSVRQLGDLNPHLQPVLEGLARAATVAQEVQQLPDALSAALALLQDQFQSTANRARDEFERRLLASLDQQTNSLHDTQTAITDMSTQLGAALAMLQQQLENYSRQMLLDQFNQLQATLENILTRMSGRAGLDLPALRG